MRSPDEARPLSWLLSICRPWVVASLAGLGLGGSLLSYQSDEEAMNAYVESASRAMGYEKVSVTLDRPIMRPVDFASGSAVAGGGTEALFSPAAPIAASAEFGEAVGGVH